MAKSDLKTSSLKIVSIRYWAIVSGIEPVRLHYFINKLFGRRTQGADLNENDITNLSNELYRNVRKVFNVIGFDIDPPHRIKKPK